MPMGVASGNLIGLGRMCRFLSLLQTTRAYLKERTFCMHRLVRVRENIALFIRNVTLVRWRRSPWHPFNDGRQSPRRLGGTSIGCRTRTKGSVRRPQMIASAGEDAHDGLMRSADCGEVPGACNNSACSEGSTTGWCVYNDRTDAWVDRHVGTKT